MKTRELLTEWLEDYEKDRVKARTYSRYKGLIKLHITPELGDIDISEIGKKEIQDFILRQRREGNIRNGEQLSATTINLMLTVLNLAFEYGYEMDLIPCNPCARLRRIPENNKRIEAFTIDEQRKLEQTIAIEGDPRFKGILLCLYTGLRIGELLGLTWEDIDLSQGLLQINKTVYREQDNDGVWKVCIDTPKTPSSARVIPLPPYITKMLKNIRNVHIQIAHSGVI